MMISAIIIKRTSIPTINPISNQIGKDFDLFNDLGVLDSLLITMLVASSRVLYFF